MSRQGTKSELYVRTRNDRQKEFLKSEITWKIIDSDQCSVPGFRFITEYLLEFPSITSRKQFVKNYCMGGHTYGKNTYMSRFGPWKDVCSAHLNDEVTVKETGVIKLPAIDILGFRYPEIYEDLRLLYKALGFSTSGGYAKLKGVAK